jgi:hypothetical protein
MPEKLVFGGTVLSGVRRSRGQANLANISSKQRLLWHYHFYTTGYQHIQIMIDIFSLKTLF